MAIAKRIIKIKAEEGEDEAATRRKFWGEIDRNNNIDVAERFAEELRDARSLGP